MNAIQNEHTQLDEDDWQVVDSNWWQIHFASVNWSFTAPFKLQSSRRKRRVVRPPFYHDALFLSKADHVDISAVIASVDDGCDEDVSLNPELEGVRSTGGVVQSYESDVGFYFTDDFEMDTMDEDESPPGPTLTVVDPEEAMAALRERWMGLVLELTGGVHLQRMLRIKQRLADLGQRKSSDSAPVDFTVTLSSDITPKPPHQWAMGTDATPATTSPSRPLNVSASEFVPSSPLARRGSVTHAAAPLSPNSPGFVHTFPSLDVPPIPDVQIKKDDQGFYTEVTDKRTPRPTPALLPPFLHEGHRSKSHTRAIVDSIRSARSEDTVLTMKSHTPSPSPAMHDLGTTKHRGTVSEDGGDRDSMHSRNLAREDEEGWIGGNEATEPNTRETKAQRTRDLFLAWTRRRTDSLASNGANKGSNSSLTVNGRKDSMDLDRSTSSLSSSPSPKSPYSDGWIDSSSLVQQSLTPTSLDSTDPRSESRSTTTTTNATMTTTTRQHHLHHHRNKSSISNSTQLFTFPYAAVTTNPTTQPFQPSYVTPSSYHSSASAYFYAAAAAAYHHHQQRPTMFPMPYTGSPTGTTSTGSNPYFYHYDQPRVVPLPFPLTQQQPVNTGTTLPQQQQHDSDAPGSTSSASSLSYPQPFPYVKSSVPTKATAVKNMQSKHAGLPHGPTRW